MQTELSGADGDLASSSLQHKISYHLKKKLFCFQIDFTVQEAPAPHPSPPPGD